MGHRLQLLMHKESERFDRELQARQEASPGALVAHRPPSQAPTPVLSVGPPGTGKSDKNHGRSVAPVALPLDPTDGPAAAISPRDLRTSEDLSKLQKRLDEVEVDLVHLKAVTDCTETERNVGISRLQSHLGEARNDISAAEERFARALLTQQGETAESFKRIERRLQAQIADAFTRMEAMATKPAAGGEDAMQSEQPQPAQVANLHRSPNEALFALHQGLSETGVVLQTPAQQLLEELQRHPNKAAKDNARIKSDEVLSRKDFCLSLESKLPPLPLGSPAQQFQQDIARKQGEAELGAEDSERGTYQRVRGLKLAMDRHRTLTEEALKGMDEKVTRCLAAVDNLSGRGNQWETVGDRLRRQVQTLEESCNRAAEETGGAKLRGLVENACHDLRQELRKQVLEPWRREHESEFKRIFEQQAVEVKKAVDALRQDLREEATEAAQESRMELHGRLETFAESLKARCGLAEEEGRRVEQYCRDSVEEMRKKTLQQDAAGQDLVKRLEQGLKGMAVVAELTRRKVDEHAKSLLVELRESVDIQRSNLANILDEKISEERVARAAEILNMNGTIRERMDALEGACQSRMDAQAQGQRSLAAEWANHQAASKLYIRSLWKCWEKEALDRERTFENDASMHLNQLREEMRSQIPVLAAELRAVFACTATSLEQRAQDLEKSVQNACDLCQSSVERAHVRFESEAQAVRRLCHEELREVRSHHLTLGAGLGVVKESRLRHEVCNLVAMIAVREASGRVQQRLIKSEVSSLRVSASTQIDAMRGRMEAELGAAQTALQAASKHTDEQPRQVELALRDEIAQATASCFMKAVASDAQIREELDSIWRSETAGLSDRFANLQEEVRMLSQLLPR
eukprot:gnl/MRDRNA2_/MRDRNA2_110432_c0_seq1.p1 gnl/MRDRNA2_/MRDRNA2_110432_c0~~gnl/MRDRNA2_/MRDRNA2_110432_c0_seq1.p1  ORF type:complete len:962 (-),score=237.17 gnl/MRDRNA2_/MRDRNA2_110432_c0_seq1:84-2675(-)